MACIFSVLFLLCNIHAMAFCPLDCNCSSQQFRTQVSHFQLGRRPGWVATRTYKLNEKQKKTKKKRNIKSYGRVQFTHCHRCMASKKKRGWCSNKYKSESHKNVRLGAAGVRSLAERKDCGVVLLA